MQKQSVTTALCFTKIMRIDGGLALLHEVAGDLPGVLHYLLREEVRREGLLDAGAARILLVGENPIDSGGVPFALAI